MSIAAPAGTDATAQADTQPKQKIVRSVGPFNVALFVIVGILFWSVFAYLANRVVACAATATWPWPFAGGCQISSDNTRDAIVIVGTLPFAIWASARIFFPPED
jgi:hypothetical protein